MFSHELVGKDVLKLLGRSIRVVAGDVELQSEVALFQRALSMRLCLLCDLLPDSPSARVFFQQWKRTILSVREIDVGLYAGDWALLKEALLSSLGSWENHDLRDWPPAFKQQVRGQIHYKWIWNSFEAICTMEGTIGAAVQWIVFDEKLNLRSYDLTEAMVLSYRQLNEDQKDWSYDLPQILYEIADEWSSGFCLQDFPFVPKHGNGATAEVPRRRATAGRKDEHLVYDEAILEWVKRRDISNIDPDWFFPAGRVERVNRVARLQCVPKSMTKNRTISAEPTVLQYLQQDLFRVWDDYFRSHLADHVDLHDQSRSVRVCLQASVSGAISSIDLSNASDSVTRTLLELLLRGTDMDDLLDGCLATRSTHCLLPDGAIIPLEKYGGMGNGTTFPVETFLFAMLCEYAIRVASGSARSLWEYYVYGDDILIDTRAVPALLKILQECHFTVNSSKSYWTTTNHIFREACGMWAVDGVDITPLRLSRRLYWDQGSEPSEAAGWVSLYNDSLRRGLLTLRYGINLILRATRWFSQIPRLGYYQEKAGETRDSLYALTYDVNATDWNVLHRTAWRQKGRKGGWQNRQALVLVPRTVATGPADADESRYFHWQLSTLQSDRDPGDMPEPEPFSIPSTVTQRWVKTWVVVE